MTTSWGEAIKAGMIDPYGLSCALVERNKDKQKLVMKVVSP